MPRAWPRCGRRRWRWSATPTSAARPCTPIRRRPSRQPHEEAGMKAKDLVWVLLMGAVVTVSFVTASRRSDVVAPVTSPDGPPVTIEPVEGTDIHRLTLSARAAERLGIETAVMGAPVATAASRLAGVGASAGARVVVPYSAVLYDARGDTWVYTSPEALVFVRQRVSVDRIDGDRVILTDGPPAGVTFVTVGGAELLAAELGH